MGEVITSSIFALRCTQCGHTLEPITDSRWFCASCQSSFEVCGTYHIPLVEPLTTDPLESLNVVPPVVESDSLAGSTS